MVYYINEIKVSNTIFYFEVLFMNIYAISDLHLSKGTDKPMDIFGSRWVNHWEKIQTHWQQKVNEDDVVLIPGDISWGINLEEAMPDLLDISYMPGKKILLEGNHDYWWSSPTKLRSVLPCGMEIIQNDFIDIGAFLVCGSRGWLLPGDDRFEERDEKIYRRELIRLELSLSKAASFSAKPIICMMHYPPFNQKHEPSGFIDIMKKYNVECCIFGHLHGAYIRDVPEGAVGGINFHMVSCDYLNFEPKRIY